MAAATSERIVKFLAIARLTDKAIICSHTVAEEPGVDFASRLAAIIEHGKWSSVKSHLLIRVRAGGLAAWNVLKGLLRRTAPTVFTSSLARRLESISP
jgi:hypothetical protein